MQGAEECQLRRISNTPQGEAIEGNVADDTLMVDQGIGVPVDFGHDTMNNTEVFNSLSFIYKPT